MQKNEKTTIINYVNLDLKNIQNTLSTYKHKKIAISAAIFIVLICIFFFYLGIQTPETTPDNPKPRSFPERISQGFQEMKSSIGLGGKQAKISPILGPKGSPNQHTTKTYAAKEIADSTITFLNNQLRPDGFYNFELYQTNVCTKQSNASGCIAGDKNVIEIVNMWTILGRLGYYRSFSRNPTDLTPAKTDADMLISYCQDDPKKCFGATVSFAELWTETNENKYKQFLDRLGESLLTLNSNDLMTLGIQTRALGRMYALTHDTRYLDLAKQKLTELTNTSLEYKTQNGKEDFLCYVLLAKSEIGQSANDQTILKETSTVLSNNEETVVSKQLTLIQPCIETAFNLAKYTNDQMMKNKAVQLLKQYVSERWDGPGLGRSYGLGGFAATIDPRFINITDTGYMLYLLSLEQDLSYDVNTK